MDFIESAINANREVFGLLNSNFDEFLFCHMHENEEIRGAGGDRSLRIDVKAEEIFVSYLKKFGKINSEESGLIGEGENEIILDPIDGSSNIASCFPYYASSISLKVRGKTVKSIVTNLANGDFFVNDEGNFYKSSLISLKRTNQMACVFPKIGIVEKAYANPQLVAKLHETGMKFRSPGAVALSLAYARDVNFVIFAEKHRVYDVDAGLFLCDGLHRFVREDFILISREKKIFDAIKELIFSKGFGR